MQTDALNLALKSDVENLPERITWGELELHVTNLTRAVAFWTKSLGLHVRDINSDRAVLGTQDKTLFILRAGATQPVSPQHLGMYHFAIGVPDQYEFSRHLARLIEMQVPCSPVDHLMSKAIYISDPDGIEIEIAFETPERFGRFGDMSHGLSLYDANGSPHSGRASLNVAAELRYAAGAEVKAPLSCDAFLAHVHFKVDELESVAAWFESIGFARNLMIPSFGFADMGAGADYTHRVAMNIWAGPNLTPTPNTMARLSHYTLISNDPTTIKNTAELTPYENGLRGVDPTGVNFTLINAN